MSFPEEMRSFEDKALNLRKNLESIDRFKLVGFLSVFVAIIPAILDGVPEVFVLKMDSSGYKILSDFFTKYQYVMTYVITLFGITSLIAIFLEVAKRGSHVEELTIELKYDAAKFDKQHLDLILENRFKTRRGKVDRDLEIILKFIKEEHAVLEEKDRR